MSCIEDKIILVCMVPRSLSPFVIPCLSYKGIVHSMQLYLLSLCHDICVILWIGANNFHLNLLSWIHVSNFFLLPDQSVDFAFCPKNLIVVRC